MAARKSLNPQAPEYVPISQSTYFPQYSHTYQVAPLIPAAVSPPSGHITFPPPHLPTYLTPAAVYTESSCFRYSSTTTLSFQPPHHQPITFPPPSSGRQTLVPRLISTHNDTGRKFLPNPQIRARVGTRSGGRRGREETAGTSLSDHRNREAGFGRKPGIEKHQMLHLRSDEDKTTVMIKNIPYDYTRGMLMEFLDEHCMSENRKVEVGSFEVAAAGQDHTLSAYDFLYLPIDFKTKKNKGYAFLNFTQSRAVWKFFRAFNGTKWDFNNSPKIRKIVSARIQGKEALVQHFEKSNFECESDEFLPICFDPPRDGSVKSAEAVPTTVGKRRGTSPSRPNQPNRT